MVTPTCCRLRQTDQNSEDDHSVGQIHAMRQLRMAALLAAWQCVPLLGGESIECGPRRTLAE
jgi:hypothetical protein